MTDTKDVVAIAAGLTKAQLEAIVLMPVPRAGNPSRHISARGYGNLWRKMPKHWWELMDLRDIGLVENTESRGETLWRLTRPLGLAVRAHLTAGATHDR